MKTRYNLDAIEEAKSAAKYYEERSPGLGDEFVDGVFSAIARAAENPNHYQVVPQFVSEGIRRVIVDRFPYVVYFVVHEEHVVVLSIAHGRRRPGYWLRRLAPDSD